MRRRFTTWALVLLAAACLLAAGALPAQTRVKRLILKDGTYQLATQWEVKGDRVRYYSSERSEWEELPYALVDWPATEQFEKDQAAGKVTAEGPPPEPEPEEEPAADVAKTPTVAPGLKLPDTGGVFLLDTYQNQQELAEVAQNGGEINANRGGNILRAVINPLSGPKQSIELRGAHARVQAHELQPAFYVNVEEESPDTDDSDSGAKSKKPEKPLTGGERFRILRAEPKKDARVIGNLKIALTGKVSEQSSFVPVTAEAVSGGWYKVTPTAPLKPGEYALVEMLSPREMNLYVWDFGVDPAAPENGSAWKPASAGAARGPDQQPTLEKRPKK